MTRRGILISIGFLGSLALLVLWKALERSLSGEGLAALAMSLFPAFLLSIAVALTGTRRRSLNLALSYSIAGLLLLSGVLLFYLSSQISFSDKSLANEMREFHIFLAVAVSGCAAFLLIRTIVDTIAGIHPSGDEGTSEIYFRNQEVCIHESSYGTVLAVESFLLKNNIKFSKQLSAGDTFPNQRLVRFVLPEGIDDWKARLVKIARGKQPG